LCNSTFLACLRRDSQTRVQHCKEARGLDPEERKQLSRCDSSPVSPTINSPSQSEAVGPGEAAEFLSIRQRQLLALALDLIFLRITMGIADVVQMEVARRTDDKPGP
jgi:hypothetical protein